MKEMIKIRKKKKTKRVWIKNEQNKEDKEEEEEKDDEKELSYETKNYTGFITQETVFDF